MAGLHSWILDSEQMTINLKTLFLLTVDVEAMLGLLLLLVWIQRRATPAIRMGGLYAPAAIRLDRAVRNVMARSRTLSPSGRRTPFSSPPTQ